MRKRKPIEHKCSLPKEEHLIVRYIDSGYFVYLRRRVKMLLMISRNHPGSKECFGSQAAIRHEESRHLQHYYSTVHPFSMGRMYWQLFMCVVFFLSLMMGPIYFSAEELEWEPLKFVFDSLCCCDVAVNFCTGYYNRNLRQVVLGKKQLIYHYATTYLPTDLLASLPLYFIITSILRIRDTQNYIKLVVLTKMFRIVTLLRYLNVFRDYMDYSLHKFKVFKMMLFFVIMAFWWSSIEYVIAKHNLNSWLHRERTRSLADNLIRACFKTVYMLLLVGHTDGITKTLFGKVLKSLILQVGFILKLYMSAQVVQILCKYNSSGAKYEQRMRQINDFVRYKGLPDWMKRKLCRYFEFKYQKRFVNEQELLAAIPPHLRKEITLQASRDFLEKVEFFQGLPNSIILRVLSSLKINIFLENDIIIRAGADGDSMFFISFGTVAVYTHEGKELCHLEDGAYFGEIALVLEDQKRFASVVAINACEVFELKRKDFYHALEPYPEHCERLKKMARDRMNTAVDKAAYDLNDDFVKV